MLTFTKCFLVYITSKVSSLGKMYSLPSRSLLLKFSLMHQVFSFFEKQTLTITMTFSITMTFPPYICSHCKWWTKYWHMFLISISHLYVSSLFECLFQNNLFEDIKLVESRIELFYLLKRQGNRLHLEQHFHLEGENAWQN